MSTPDPRDAVVFLDIDRVCNNAVTRQRLWQPRIETDPIKFRRAMVSTLAPELVARVQSLCDRGGASVVIVSGWRRRMPHDEIVAALCGAGLTAPVLGAVRDVPEAARGPGGDARRAGVREWLDQRPEVVRWVVVDDHEQHWTERDGGTGWEALPAWLAGRTVHPRDGMTEEDVEAALRALGRPARPDQ